MARYLAIPEKHRCGSGIATGSSGWATKLINSQDS